MAGRPRGMSRKMNRLLERYFARKEDLVQLMPKQYLEPTKDSLGSTWQEAVETIGSISDYLEDLAGFLDFKAAEAERRTKAAGAANRLSLVTADPDQGEDDEAAVEESSAPPEGVEGVSLPRTTPNGLRGLPVEAAARLGMQLPHSGADTNC